MLRRKAIPVKFPSWGLGYRPSGKPSDVLPFKFQCVAGRTCPYIHDELARKRRDGATKSVRFFGKKRRGIEFGDGRVKPVRTERKQELMAIPRCHFPRIDEDGLGHVHPVRRRCFVFFR